MWANNDSDTADFFCRWCRRWWSRWWRGRRAEPAASLSSILASCRPAARREERGTVWIGVARARLASVGADIKRVFSVLVRCGGLREGRKMLKGKEGQKARDRRDGALAKSAGEKQRQEAGGSKEMTDQLSSNPSCSVLHQSNSISTE